MLPNMELRTPTISLYLSRLRTFAGIHWACAFAALLLSGCIIVPIPHERMHEMGVKGHVIDATTHAPIEGATIETLGDNPREAISKADGSFRVKPLYGWHGAYMVAAISGPVFPDMPKSSAIRFISVTARGYHEVKIPVRILSTVDTYVQAGDIMLQRL
jgi:hypothetical protein